MEKEKHHLEAKDSSDGSENDSCFNDISSNTPKQPPPPHKKQVRRRSHTTKPYQQRLLNMAEARREIVTALKFHRASMKQQEAAAAAEAAAASAAANHHHSPPQSSFGQERKPKSRPIHSLYHPTTAATTTASSYWPTPTFSPPPPPPPPCYHDNKNLILPTQPLGLNLDIQSFTNLDTEIYHKPYSNGSSSSSSTSSSTPSSSSSPAISAPSGNPNSSTDLHHSIDDDVIQEIRSLGNQHQIEWNDTINLVKSARWCGFLKTMEVEANEDDCDHGFYQFDRNLELPPWLINGNESSCVQQFDEHVCDAYFQDPELACMDIGEIEAMDEGWLA